MGKEILDAPALGVDRHRGLCGHLGGGCDQREVLAVPAPLEQQAHGAIEVSHGCVERCDVSKNGVFILIPLISLISA